MDEVMDKVMVRVSLAWPDGKKRSGHARLGSCSGNSTQDIQYNLLQELCISW